MGSPLTADKHCRFHQSIFQCMMSRTCSSLCCGNLWSEFGDKWSTNWMDLANSSGFDLEMNWFDPFQPLLWLRKGSGLADSVFVVTQVSELRKPTRGGGETSSKQEFPWKIQTALHRKGRGAAPPVTLLREKQENSGHDTGTKAKAQRWRLDLNIHHKGVSGTLGTAQGCIFLMIFISSFRIWSRKPKWEFYPTKNACTQLSKPHQTWMLVTFGDKNVQK